VQDVVAEVHATAAPLERVKPELTVAHVELDAIVAQFVDVATHTPENRVPELQRVH